MLPRSSFINGIHKLLLRLAMVRQYDANSTQDRSFERQGILKYCGDLLDGIKTLYSECLSILTSLERKIKYNFLVFLLAQDYFHRQYSTPAHSTPRYRSVERKENGVLLNLQKKQ